MNIICVVTARKNSKTIKNKNLIKINKLSLIEYTFRQINKSILKRKTFILTDSDKIKEIAKKYKINTDYIRPKSVSLDNTSSAETLNNFSKWYRKKNDYDAIVLLQPTSPLRTFIDINKSIEIFLKEKTDSLFSISESLEHPYETINLKKKNKIFFNLKKSKKYYRRQDFDLNSHFINGAIYIVKKKIIEQKKMYNINNHSFYKMPKIRSFDINDVEDLNIIKKIINE